MKIAIRLVVLCAILSVAAVALYGQRFGGGERDRQRRQDLGVQIQGNTEYDGRYVFVRIRYNSGFGGGFGRRFGGGRGPGWSHDYPDGEVHFSKILEELTLLRIRTDGSNILSLDDPELGNYPVAYMAEPGMWQPSAAEADGLRKYLLKGGFIIFDDFRGYDWQNLQDQMRAVLPELRWFELNGTEAVFHSFFEIDNPQSFVPPYGATTPSFWGLFEDNDPKKRLVAIANVDNDLSEYWEFSGTGYAPVDLTNESYKFGINYVIYALTH